MKHLKKLFGIANFYITKRICKPLFISSLPLRGEERSLLIDIANIPFGHANAIPRPEDRKTDRALRRKIEKANKNGDCIINTGFGYFRPDPRDEVDVHEFYLYISQNNSKAREILGKNGILVKTFERWLRNGIPVNNTRAAG